MLHKKAIVVELGVKGAKAVQWVKGFVRVDVE